MIDEIQYLKFGGAQKSVLEAVGVSFSAVEEMFLCVSAPETAGFMLPGAPSYGVAFQTRERRAASLSSRTIRDAVFRLPSPWSPARLSAATALTIPWRDELRSIFFLPLIYAFHEGTRTFFVVTCGITGRLVHLYFPDLKIAIYDISLPRAQVIQREFEAHEALLRETDVRHRQATGVDTVAVLDMVNNYGHQMINHLSALDELIEAKLMDRIAKVFLAGAEFFGPTTELYPEIAHKLRHFASKEELSAHILVNPMLAVRIGANAFRSRTRDRILAYARGKTAFKDYPGRFPVIAITVRAWDRVCLNLKDVLDAMYRELGAKYPSIAFVVDGWVNAEVGARLNHPIAQSERVLFRELFRDIPDSVVVDCLIETSMSESIAALMNADVYFAHVGTLQHKTAFLGLKSGVVHGPRAQMTTIDSGAFQAELGPTPTYLHPDCIRDAPDPRDPRRSGYEILDIPGCVAILAKLIDDVDQHKRHAGTPPAPNPH